jgi:uncharacterized protein YabE (DUF348 family)
LKLADRIRAMPPRARLALVLLGVLAVAAAGFFLGVRKTVTLRVNGSERTLTTYSLRVSDLLASQGIAVSPDDQLSPALGAWLRNGSSVSLVRAIPVQVLADGKIKSISSPSRLPADLLSQAGVQASAADQLLSDGRPVDPLATFPPDSSSISLQLVRAVHFTLSTNGETQTLTSTAPTLGAALWAAGYSLYAADQLSPGAETALSEGLAATLNPSRLVTIHTLAGERTFRSAARTVGQALEDAHLSLQGLDYSLPGEDQPIPANGKLRVVRVTEQVLIEQTPLPFETEYQPASDLELDSQAVLQAGEYGLNAQRVRVRYEDGAEASRKVESEWVARQPQARIIGYGTAVVMHTTVVDGVQIQYWRALSMYATSYHPSEVGDTTASGLPLKKGVAAVDTSIVPFYTQLYIPGYGEAVAADIGGGVIGRWIDLGYSDNDYVAWHSWVTVYFLWPPPDNIVWVVP